MSALLVPFALDASGRSVRPREANGSEGLVCPDCNGALIDAGERSLVSCQGCRHHQPPPHELVRRPSSISCRCPDVEIVSAERKREAKRGQLAHAEAKRLARVQAEEAAAEQHRQQLVAERAAEAERLRRLWEEEDRKRETERAAKAAALAARRLELQPVWDILHAIEPLSLGPKPFAKKPVLAVLMCPLVGNQPFDLCTQCPYHVGMAIEPGDATPWKIYCGQKSKPEIKLNEPLRMTSKTLEEMRRLFHH